MKELHYITQHHHAATADIGERVATLFEQRGIRWTLQRRLILNLLQQEVGFHLTVDQIFSQIAPLYPSINITTVYRTLEVLHELGIVSVIEAGRNDINRRYELVQAVPHYHIRCTHCGDDVEIDASIVEQLQATTLEAHQIRLHFGHVIGAGLCEQCKSTQ